MASPQQQPTALPSSSFRFPREYNFPPFFTLQTNPTTLHAQLTKWSALILSYARSHHVFRLRLSAVVDTELFSNKTLNRKLQIADIRQVVAFMVKDGRAEFADGGSSNSKASGGGGGGEVVFLWWNTPEEWAAVVEDFVDGLGQKGSVLTLWELSEGESTKGTDLQGIDKDVLIKALNVLVKKGKAQIFGADESLGVKFF